MRSCFARKAIADFVTMKKQPCPAKKPMLSQQIEDKSQHLESRVATLETEILQMRQMLSAFVQKKTPWWLKVSGSFENDSSFDEATRLGQEWCKSAE